MYCIRYNYLYTKNSVYTSNVRICLQSVGLEVVIDEMHFDKSCNVSALKPCCSVLFFCHGGTTNEKHKKRIHIG